MRGRLLVLMLLALFVPGARYSASEWKDLQKLADKVEKKPDYWDDKKKLVDGIAKEESKRSTKMLLRIAVDSMTREKQIRKDLAKAWKEFEKEDRAAMRKLGPGASWKDRQAREDWDEANDEVTKHRTRLRTERRMQTRIGEVIGRRPTPETLSLVTGSAAKRARKSPGVRRGVLTVLLAQPGGEHDAEILAFGRDEECPFGQLDVLAWIRKHKRADGRAVAEACLTAERQFIARDALRTLLLLDDPACVGAMVKAREKATGLLAEELELALYRFTGQKHFGPGSESGWSDWWKSNGERFLANPPKERLDTKEIRTKAKTRFYGIPTRSDRIVFVIDASGSMNEPVEGENMTRFEVARRRLISAVKGLPKSARFSIVLFGGGWKSWPVGQGAAAEATPENREDAAAFLHNYTPSGSTPLFKALSRARWYGQVFDFQSVLRASGVDTVFLLSDGAPTTPNGKFHSKEELKKLTDDFLKYNAAAQKLVVHTIGVGPDHAPDLLKRLSAETGGTYRAVGIEKKR